MATSQQFLINDCSTLANFKSWAQAISSFMTTAGWLQGSDTGQVNWSTISTVPGTNAYVYEIWQPNDGLTNFFLKVEYGNNGGTNNPAVRLSIGTGTNGAGTLTGVTVGTFVQPSSLASSPTTTFECNFFGSPGLLAIMLWRNGTGSAAPFVFCVERSLNSSGSYTNGYVTLWTVGGSSLSFNQQSIVFGIGVAPSLTSQPGSIRGQFGGISGAFNGSIPADLCAPYVGFWDQQCTVLGSASAADFTEGISFAGTVYGSTRTYMPTKFGGGMNRFGPGNNSWYVTCMRIG